MINLLPPAEKQKLFLKETEKIITIWGIVIAVFLVCLTLILLSIKFYILSETDYHKNILNQNIKNNQTAEFVSLSDTIKKYNTILSKLNFFYEKEIYLNQVINTITSIEKPTGIFLENYSFIREKDGSVQARVSGFSDTRENLLIFKKNIEENKYIKNPSFSTESWINPKNIEFLFTFKVEKIDNEK